MQRAIGISVHTGWGACVVVGGSVREPEIFSNSVIELLDAAERFCYHRAAGMNPVLVQEWLTRVRAKALAKARSELVPQMQAVRIGAIVAKDGAIPELQAVLASHMRIHSAEGFFYRDVFRQACQVPCRLVAPGCLDISAIGKAATRPWGRDQKLAALAALQLINE